MLDPDRGIEVSGGIEEDLDDLLKKRRCVELQRTDNKEKASALKV